MIDPAMMEEAPRNIKLTIEYDGSAYHGWQRQANAATVQEVLEDAMAGLVGHPVTLYGSGRTDAGVHALGQVANFRTTSTIPTERFHLAINGAIPRDIAVLSAEDVPDDFHARYSATGKTYRYTIVCRPVRPAVGAAFVHWVRSPLDADRMAEAAACFVGEHDFAAFETESKGEGTVRTVTRADVERVGDRILYTVSANGFLYNMVRAMVGTLIEVGLGKREPADVARLLESRDRAQAGPTAPPGGLCLLEVTYA
jgi:tRNA pseudouridine38-40 synthase